MDTIDYLIRDLCEIPDRNSPDDQPEMLLVTAAEIRTAIERWIPAIGDPTQEILDSIPLGCGLPVYAV